MNKDIDISKVIFLLHLVKKFHDGARENCDQIFKYHGQLKHTGIGIE